MVNDFGTNNAVAGVLAGIAMVIGALAWCVGYRWGAGLAGGAGAALAGWVALLARTRRVADRQRRGGGCTRPDADHP